MPLPRYANGWQNWVLAPNGAAALRAPIQLRGAAVEPPAFDIGTDLLDIERRAAEPARITISRQSPKDVGYREIYVSLDGTSLTMLQYGDSHTTEVMPGPHRLRAHNTLIWKTLPIVLRPGEHAKFTAINRTGTISFGLLFMLGAFPLYLTFERDREPVSDLLTSSVNAPNPDDLKFR